MLNVRNWFGASSSPAAMSAKALATATLVGGVALLFSDKEAQNSSAVLHAPAQPWDHSGMFNSLDYNSVRRGFHVFKSVCSSCHSVELLAYRHMAGVFMTEAEAKALAADSTFKDGPDDEGEMFERPGKLTDYIPKPYPNEKAARFTNNGALPPDLSLMTRARFNGEDYLYGLLTGYRPVPAGVQPKEGLHYNPYFPGSWIAMAQALHEGGVEYDDGTEASISQQAKDVTTFLSWAAEPKQDERKLLGIKFFFCLGLAFFPALYTKRMKWSVAKNRKITFH